MMIFTNKNDFLFNLHQQLYKRGVKDCGDILNDFEQHFVQGETDGLSERQVCEKLGDVTEIAEQYTPGYQTTSTDMSPGTAGTSGGAGTADGTGAYYQDRPRTEKANISGLIGIILVDLFIFSWAIPTLFSLVVAYFSVVFGFAVGGACIVLFDIADNFINIPFYSNPLPIVPTMFLALILISGTVAMACGIKPIGRGFIGICKRIINWHVAVIRSFFY